MTPKPRSPMPIRVEIWDTKNRNSIGADPALRLRPEPASQSRPIGFDPGCGLGIAWPTTGFTLRGSLSVLLVIVALYGLWTVLP